MKIIVFGVGAYYKKHIQDIKKKDEVIALLDNNSDLWETFRDGVKIIPPEKITALNYDYVVVLAKIPSAVEMRDQLLDIGVLENKILYIDEYYGIRYSGDYEEYYIQAEVSGEKKAALISRALDYSGSTVVLNHMAAALMTLGIDVSLVVPEADEKYLRELSDFGMRVVIYPSIVYMGQAEQEWLEQFDIVIVNTFPMINCALKVKNKKKIWWLHEAGEKYSATYPYTLMRYKQLCSLETADTVEFYAVSRIAKENFNYYFPDRIQKLLPYGIPDTYIEKCPKKNKIKQVFAVIGGISELKAQMVFLQAAEILNKAYENKIEYWLIGSVGKSEYANAVKRLAAEMPNVKICGVMTRRDLEAAFEEIDVIVCPSMEETMSAVVIEGMMHKKVCVVSDNTGIADYITDEENGLVCKAGQVDSLVKKLEWVIIYEKCLPNIREKARQTYLSDFSMEIFSNRLEKILL